MQNFSVLGIRIVWWVTYLPTNLRDTLWPWLEPGGMDTFRFVLGAGRLMGCSKAIPDIKLEIWELRKCRVKRYMNTNIILTAILEKLWDLF